MSTQPDANRTTPAPRGRRLLAQAIDLGILLLVSLPLVKALTHGDMERLAAYAMNSAPAWLGIIGFNLFILDSCGQTIGKRLMKIRIVATDGARVGLSKLLFIRYLPFAALASLPYLGPVVILLVILSGLRKDGRGIHDYLADTQVVEL